MDDISAHMMISYILMLLQNWLDRTSTKSIIIHIDGEQHRQLVTSLLVYVMNNQASLELDIVSLYDHNCYRALELLNSLLQEVSR